MAAFRTGCSEAWVPRPCDSYDPVLGLRSPRCLPSGLCSLEGFFVERIGQGEEAPEYDPRRSTRCQTVPITNLGTREHVSHIGLCRIRLFASFSTVEAKGEEEGSVYLDDGRHQTPRRSLPGMDEALSIYLLPGVLLGLPSGKRGRSGDPSREANAELLLQWFGLQSGSVSRDNSRPTSAVSETG